MGDGSSSSSSSSSMETVVIDHGRRRSSCGYCHSTDRTSISHGLWALSLTAGDYQELLDQGWRRSGSFLYKPEMEKTCCPSYTIRLKASDFVPSKEQIRVRRRMQRFLDGTIDMKKPDNLKDKTRSSKDLTYQVGNASSSTASVASVKEPSASMYEEDKFIPYLSRKIDDAINLCVGSAEFPFHVQLPKAIVKKVSLQAKRKLTEISEGLLYTSNIAFLLSVALRKLRPAEPKLAHADKDGELMDVSSNVIAEKLACFMEQLQDFPHFSIRACKGHLNFYSDTKRDTSMLFNANVCKQNSKESQGNSKSGLVEDNKAFLPRKQRHLEICMKLSSFDPEEFTLYKKYQTKVHGDKPEKVTESSYNRFLVDSPIQFVPPNSDNKSIPPCGFGSFHQQYLIDGKLVAVGVVDILPKCLSSKYLFWDPDFSFLSLGKYSALQEINWIKETQVYCPTLQYYYLGYYIHSCNKMRYKAAYCPSELLCPLRHKWVPFDIAKPLLDKMSYVILSDYVGKDSRAPLPMMLGTSNGQSGSHLDHDRNEASSDEEDLDFEVSDMILDDESDTETFSAPMTDELYASNISDIVIDLNGSRVRYKELEQVFGPIEKRQINELEMQLHRYVKAAGEELSKCMVYSL